MFILSAGMQKSGSAYVYNILNDLQIAVGNANARNIRNKYKLENLMKWHNNNIASLTFTTMFKLWVISVREKPFVVKTHNPPAITVKMFNQMGLIKIVYGYRDPRDVILSAMDHGKKILTSGENHTFSRMVEFEDALANVDEWIKTWRKYSQMANVLMIKYEDLLEDQDQVMKKIEGFLDISIDQEKRNNILWKYSRDNVQASRTGLHFNKAKTYRYRTEMSDKQKLRCKEELGDCIEEMGYN